MERSHPSSDRAARLLKQPALNAVLISTYDLGRQPFGLASPAAWLKAAGIEVRCLDLAIHTIDEDAISRADLIAFHLPMHTATRMAMRLVARVRAINQDAILCFYGLYAAMNERLLRRLGAAAVLSGEFEEQLLHLALRIAGGEALQAQDAPVVSTRRLDFLVPDRDGLPPLSRYARVVMPDGSERVTGYTEASRGCKHLCRHCPIVPVYDGLFRIVQPDVVLEDVRRQVEAGAQHITFGDPDFLNAPRHAMEIVSRLHAAHPDLTWDATIKVEHLLRCAPDLPRFVAYGCLFVTSAIESFDDEVLAALDKGHTAQDALRAVALCRASGLELNPTFVAFTPWTTRASYAGLLTILEDNDLVERVAPIQLALRLLIPAGSRLLELAEVRLMARGFDEEALIHPWTHADPEVDELQEEVMAVVRSQDGGAERRALFAAVAGLAGHKPRVAPATARAAIPFLTEPWYC